MEDWLRGVVADRVLHRVLGKFISGIDKDSLNLNLSKGDIALHSLSLNLDTFEALDLPLAVAGGTLGEVRVKVPWNNLGKEPMRIVIDRVYLLLLPKDGSALSADVRDAAAAAAKGESLEAWEALQERKKEQHQGWVGEQVEKLVRGILQKLEISITNVHVRVQLGEGAGAIAAGVVLKSVQVTDLPRPKAESARHGGAKLLERMLASLVRKTVAVHGLAVYLSSGGSGGGGSGGGSSSEEPPGGQPRDVGAAAPRSHLDRAAWERLMLPMLQATDATPDHVLPPLDATLEVICFRWLPMASDGFRWLPMASDGFRWLPMVSVASSELDAQPVTPKSSRRRSVLTVRSDARPSTRLNAQSYRVSPQVEFDPAADLDPSKRPWPRLCLVALVSTELALRMRQKQVRAF